MLLEKLKGNLTGNNIDIEARKTYLHSVGRFPSEIRVRIEKNHQATKDGKKQMAQLLEKIKKDLKIKEEDGFTREFVPVDSENPSTFNGVYDITKDDSNPVMMAFGSNYFLFLFKKKDKHVEKVLSSVSKSKLEENTKDKIYLIAHNQFSGFYLQEFKFDEFEFDLKSHYNEDFIKEHDKIFDGLTNQKTGLVLLHGKHGTGKTFYIRYLTRLLDKKVIYISPNMINKISGENFIPFLSSNPNSVLVMEDAENAIAKRQGGNNQAVSNLLNISEGLLGDALKIQLIVTFNETEKEIDEALLRKGRLISKYEFGNLEKSKANKLLKKLGHPKDAYVDEDTSLSDLYNIDEKSYSNKERAKVGFNT